MATASSPTDSMPSGISSGSTRSSKYSLDENDRRPILVYKYRGGGCDVQSQHDLSLEINKDPCLRVSRKPIPRGNSRIEVRHEDLFPEAERELYKDYPNMKNSLASIGLPRHVYWKRLLLDQFKDLYIVSPETSPTNSANNSKDNTPHNTWPREESS